MRAISIMSAIILLTFLLGAKMAMADVIWMVDSGKLTKAQGVNVSGNLYDVEFKEGTCASVFGACDTAHFDFTTSGSALAASQALLDQVLINIAGYPFDDSPNLTYGISSIALAKILTPYATLNLGKPTVAIAGNENASGSDGSSDGNEFSAGFDSTPFGEYVWADWTVHQNSVPEPGSLSLVAVAMFTATAVSRSRKKWRT